MTVAIAAICGGNSQIVLCATDRMLTAGDVQFEQPQPKIWRLGKNCIGLIYGNAAAQAEICLQTQNAVNADGLSNVREIVTRQMSNLQAAIRHRAEAAVLGPLGLTGATFLQQQPSMAPALVTKLSDQLQSYYTTSGLHRDLGGVIVAGSDVLGGHIYRVEHGEAEFGDHVGFLAAGSGQWHAESQFMFSRYTRWWNFPHALSLLYTAKKRAEVAPGVGRETDIIIITTDPQNFILLQSYDPLVLRLEEIYRETRSRQNLAQEYQYDETKKFLDELLKIPLATPTPTGQESAGEPPATAPEVSAPPTRQTEIMPSVHPAPAVAPPRRPTRRGSKRDRKSRPPSQE